MTNHSEIEDLLKANSDPNETFPIFKNDDNSERIKVKVMFVLGGPGAGKGTQCTKLSESSNGNLFCHLSAGDLLRAERNRQNSPVAELIHHYIKEGLIVPMQITIHLLKEAMKAKVKSLLNNTNTNTNSNSVLIFLIDGFPREIEQGKSFEEKVCKSCAIVFYECPEKVLTDRLVKRGVSSGRIDDNLESIRKRLETFRKCTEPVIEFYEKTRGANHVIRIDCDKSPETVYFDTMAKIKHLL